MEGAILAFLADFSVSSDWALRFDDVCMLRDEDGKGRVMLCRGGCNTDLGRSFSSTSISGCDIYHERGK